MGVGGVNEKTILNSPTAKGVGREGTVNSAGGCYEYLPTILIFKLHKQHHKT